ncbi:MAG TPA: hypothetical protein VMF59_04520, partial [Bacteroidota bacterium]|nr:hypothetical protein [Bacteroidota bacterium]
DFVQYAMAGVRLCYATPQIIRSHQRSGLERLLRETERVPARRETVFSYMLPRTSETALLVYNQEAAEL